LTRYEFKYLPFRGLHLPIVPVQLRTPASSWLATGALLDPGASISLLDGDIARRVAIPIRKGTRITPAGVGGAISAYVHQIILKIGDEEFEAEVAFTYRRKLPVNLLGRTGVFERFLVTFDERNRRTILETI